MIWLIYSFFTSTAVEFILDFFFLREGNYHEELNQEHIRQSICCSVCSFRYKVEFLENLAASWGINKESCTGILCVESAEKSNVYASRNRDLLVMTYHCSERSVAVRE